MSDHSHKKLAHKKLEDWMRLILLNWVMISVIMLYSIILGSAAGVLISIILNTVLSLLTGHNNFLTLYPTISPWARLIIGSLIASIFLCSFRIFRYNCQTGTYFIPKSGDFFKKILLRLGGGVLVILGLAVIAGLISAFGC